MGDNQEVVLIFLIGSELTLRVDEYREGTLSVTSR